MDEKSLLLGKCLLGKCPVCERYLELTHKDTIPEHNDIIDPESKCAGSGEAPTDYKPKAMHE